jgi:CHAT domain-containing protein/tetratricopeptide (TPR) repeat protein
MVIRAVALALVSVLALAGSAQPLAGDQPAGDLDQIRGLLNAGRYADAEAAARAALVRVRVNGEASPLDVARVLGLLVECLWRTGKANEPGSLEMAWEAVAIRETALGPDHPDVAASLIDLGRLLHEAGDYAAAKPVLERAVSIWERALGPDHPNVARSLNTLANLLRQIGDFAGARLLYERTVGIWERTVGPEDPSVATALNNLAIVIDDFGDYVDAKPLYDRALAIWEKANGPEHATVGVALNNIGLLLYHVQDYAGAVRILERALAIREKTLGPEHPQVAQGLNNLASVLRDAGEYARARPLMERGLAIREKVLGAEHPITSNSLTDLAILLHHTGEYERAKALFERAVAIRERAFGATHPVVGEALTVFAPLLAEMDQGPAAFAAALRAEAIGVEHFRLSARTLPERQGLTYATRRPSGLDVLLSLAAGGRLAPGSASALWNAVVGARALVLDEIAARHRLAGEVSDPEIDRLASTLAAARHRLARRLVRGPGGEPPEKYRASLDNARAEREAAERALAEKSVVFRQEEARLRLGLRDVTAATPAGAALVAYVRYGHADFRARSRGQRREPAPSYLALVFRKDGDPAVVPLGPAQPIDAVVAEWRQRIADGAAGVSFASTRLERLYRTSAEALRRKIWDPIAATLRGATRVFIVPDGSLHLVNVAALPAAGSRYLIETGPIVHYLSSERDLVPAPRARGEGLLALGDPAFDRAAALAPVDPPVATAERAPRTVRRLFRGARAACGEFDEMRFDALPASAVEVQRIMELWTSTRPRPGGTPAGDVLLRRDTASEAAFKAQAPGRRVLHLATHGFFLGGRCPSALQPAAKPAGDGGQSRGGENPLRLAGLALAGANQRHSSGPDAEDGILTAEEIAALDLSGVEWAVLSACDTGVGEIRAGEGIFGLRRAFRVAGAGTVIMSLWPVDDDSAREWMTALYAARFKRQQSTDEAVRRASVDVLRRRRASRQSTHPFHWAGFVAAGDWR